jgi:hypothetical protein
MSISTVHWISTEDGMPTLNMPVLVRGGCAFWDGSAWHTYMEPKHTKIQWPVTHWAVLPRPPAILRFTHA